MGPPRVAASRPLIRDVYVHCPKGPTNKYAEDARSRACLRPRGEGNPQPAHSCHARSGVSGAMHDVCVRGFTPNMGMVRGGGGEEKKGSRGFQLASNS